MVERRRANREIEAAAVSELGSWRQGGELLLTIGLMLPAVERLTGRRMDSAGDRHELWLALRARDAARISSD